MNQEFNINYSSKEELDKFNYHEMTLRNDLLDLSKKGKVLIISSQPGKGKGVTIIIYIKNYLNFSFRFENYLCLLLLIIIILINNSYY